MQAPKGQRQIANHKSQIPRWRYVPPSATPVRWSDLAASLAAVRSAAAARLRFDRLTARGLSLSKASPKSAAVFAADGSTAVRQDFGVSAQSNAHRTGPELVEGLAEALAAMTGSPSLHLTASGRAAFFLILEACKRQRPGRDEVVLPAYTCPVLAYAAQAAGLRLRLVDMEPQTLDYDRAALARAIGPRTLAVVSVHPLGLPRPLDDVRASARSRRLLRGRRRAGLRRQVYPAPDTRPL